MPHGVTHTGEKQDNNQVLKAGLSHELGTSAKGESPIHLLLGNEKQPRGLGSQHLATVRVMGLQQKGES